MAYEVSAASEVSDRLVVSVGGKTLVFGEALDSDREAADAGDVVLMDSPYGDADADLVSELNLLSERVPEVAEAVNIEYKPDPVEEAEVAVERVEVTPADPADSVVSASETTPSIERFEDEVEAVEAANQPEVERKSGPEVGADEGDDE